MLNINEILVHWLNDLENYKFPDYEKLPDIDLYMEQIITYLDRTLQIFANSSLDKQITPSMVNNYVKGQVITAPIQKKYNKEQIAMLEETYALKQVLTIGEIKQIMDAKYTGEDNAGAFNSFKKYYAAQTQEACQSAKQSLKAIENNDTNKLTDLAINLAATANAYINISKKILFLLKKNEEILENEKEKDNTGFNF